MTSGAITEGGKASKAHETGVEDECGTNKKASTAVT